jgi:putative ABC transport system ATP-binding protein
VRGRYLAVSILSMSGVCKDYKFVQALCDVDLKVHPGEFLIIMGPSGSGKSTLLHMVGLLDVPTRGQVKIEGKLVPKDENERAHLRLKFMGYVFQDFGLMSSLNVLENITLPSALAGRPQRKKAIEIARALGIDHRLHHYITQISGGEKQRVAIARALINDPKLVLADEPTGNLDSKTGEKVMQTLKDLTKEGRTVVAVTHDPSHLTFADRVVFLKDGKVENIKTLKKA